MEEPFHRQLKHYTLKEEFFVSIEVIFFIIIKKGIAPALIQGPLSRFGDTFSNTLFITFMDNSDKTRNLPVLIRTGGASVVAGLFRILLTPVDTVKTIL